MTGLRGHYVGRTVLVDRARASASERRAHRRRLWNRTVDLAIDVAILGFAGFAAGLGFYAYHLAAGH